jgi:uncharacterized membrane protein
VRKIFIFMIGLIIFAYPFIIYFGISHISVRYLALVIIFIFILRFLLLKKKISIDNKLHQVSVLVIIMGVLICILGVVSNDVLMLRLYPVLMSGCMLVVFLTSLIYPPTIIEVIARFKEPNLPIEAVKYIRKVTILWCVFFLLNMIFSLYTSLCFSIKMWVFYNGFIFYIIMGTLFSVEFIVRYFVKFKIDKRIKEREKIEKGT